MITRQKFSTYKWCPLFKALKGGSKLLLTCWLTFKLGTTSFQWGRSLCAQLSLFFYIFAICTPKKTVSPTWLIWQQKILWILYKQRPAITLIASSDLNNTVQLVDIYNSSVACLWMSWIRVIPADGILLRTSEEEEPEDRSQPPEDLRLR